VALSVLVLCLALGQSLEDKKCTYLKKELYVTEDLYDLQANQANEFNSVLQGTSGKDYEYLQKSIVDSRDRLKYLYKGKKLKDTRTPEFQSEVYNIKQDLANKRNSIDSFHGQVKQANELAKNRTSIKKKEWEDYIYAQMQLPPDQRDKDLVNKINTDPLFYSAANYGDAFLAKEKTKEVHFLRETDDLITNYEATYRERLGSYKDGVYTPNMSDALVSEALQDRQFYNAMAGMLPPEQANALIGQGLNKEFDAAVHQQAKKFLTAIQGYDPDEKQLSSKMKYQPRPTASDKKNLEEERQLGIIQQKLLDHDETAFDDFISKDVWRGFKFEYEPDGDIHITGTYLGKDQRDRNTVTKIEHIYIDPTNAASVKQAMNRIQSFDSRYKKDVTVAPSSEKKATTPKKKQGYADKL
jgi:hypothetical protein